MNRFLQVFGLIAFALNGTAAMAQPQTASVVVTPPAVSLSLGQSVQMNARVQGVPGQANVRWSLRGPRYPGVDWGRLTNSGRYTAPSRMPNGQVFITATVLGQFGQPIASASVLVHLSGGVAQPVPGPTRPPVVQPPRPGPTIPPGLIVPPTAIAPPPVARPPPRVTVPPPPVAAPPPPKVAAPPPRLPPVAAPPVAPPPVAASSATVVQQIDAGKAACRRGQAAQGASAWSQAGTAWDGLAQNARLQVVQQLVSGQLGNNATQVVVDPAVFNYGRVTADARGTKMSLSGQLTPPGSQPYYRTLLDVPLVRDPQLIGIGPNKAYRTLVHFICYETEIARIRTMIRNQCARIGGSLSGPVNTAMNDGKLSLPEYNGLMVPWNNKPLADKLAASWMIERIAAEPNPNISTCDLPLRATQPNPRNPGGIDDYSLRIAGDIKFFHDTRALNEGVRHCACQ